MSQLTGVERERVLIQSAVYRISKTIFDIPLRRSEHGDRRGFLAPPPLSAFRHLEPLGFGLVNEDDWWCFHPEDCSADLVWPLDVGVIMEKAGDQGKLHLDRTVTVAPREVRGVVTRFSPFMVREDVATVMDGKLCTATGVWAWLGGEWADANAHKWRQDGHDFPDTEHVPFERFQVRLATSLALRQRYEWAVALGMENAPSVRFVTDPTGIKELFRLRDVQDGRDRREALLTWVCDHWRQDRTDPEVEIYVRNHLRGALAFNWRGMCGEVLPSKFDIEKRDRLIGERNAMRTAGLDRRPASRSR